MLVTRAASICALFGLFLFADGYAVSWCVRPSPTPIRNGVPARMAHPSKSSESTLSIQPPPWAGWSLVPSAQSK
jgi:hypothetical protein